VLGRGYANFLERRKAEVQLPRIPKGEVRRILIPRTPVNTARTSGAHRRGASHDVEEALIRSPKRLRRYNAFPDALTDWSGGVLAENRNTSANTNGPIRVLLADDHTMFRQGLAGILASYGAMEVVAETPNDAEALKLARELSPDVVVMQVQMPFQRAIETLKAMRSFPAPPKVVIVTMFESPRYVRGLTGVGASAYLLKTSSAEHLVAAVRAAALDPSSENAVVGMPRSMLEGTEEGVDSILSARELEIVLLAARGLSNHQIASSLHLSEATVKRHLANVYPKMGVASRGEAAKEALLREWITIEELTAEEEG
jgi:DNA-binding NarL/FixJ family response regulator